MKRFLILPAAAVVLLCQTALAQAQYTIKNVQPVQSVVVWGTPRTYPPMTYGGTITYSSSMTVSTSYTATVGVSAQFVSAQLGFDVSKSWQQGISFTFNLRPNRYLTITPGIVYTRFYYEIWQGNRRVGTGTALRYEYWTYKTS